MARLDDPERLDALQRSGLMNRDARERLTSLAYSAVQLLRADASEINVHDESGEQMHAAVWPEGMHISERMPAAESGCAEVVRTESVVSIPDTSEHPIMCAMPWTHRWRGYLGAPVFYDGFTIGSVCVLTRAPRVWRPHDQIALEGLARLAGLVCE